MIVYRIEDSQGFGYKGNRGDVDDIGLCGLVQSCCIDWDKTTLFKANCRPLPWQDGVPKCFVKRSGWIFGFTFEHDIMRYFSPYDLFIMSKFGGVVVKYEVPAKSVWKGYNQCVFFKDHARVVSKQSTANYTYIRELGDWVDTEDYEETMEEWVNDTRNN